MFRGEAIRRIEGEECGQLGLGAIEGERDRIGGLIDAMCGLPGF
jgi:hypothetical protein